MACAENYFTKILEDDIKAIIKPQWVDHIPKAVSGKVAKILTDKDQREAYKSSVSARVRPACESLTQGATAA